MYYHITPASNIASITIDGLQPRLGARSHKMGENQAAAYLFVDLDSAEDAIGNWLGEELEDAGTLALVEVTIPENCRLGIGAGYEIVVLDVISPGHLKIVTMDIDGFDWQRPVPQLGSTPGFI